MLTFPAESVSLHIDRRYMYYNEFKSPALVKFGSGILRNIHDIILEAHFYFRNKILVTQEALYGQYRALFGSDAFTDVVLVQGGAVSEAPALIDLAGGLLTSGLSRLSPLARTIRNRYTIFDSPTFQREG